MKKEYEKAFRQERVMRTLTARGGQWRDGETLEDAIRKLHGDIV